MKPILVTYADAARLTGYAQSTLRRWVSEGKLTRHGEPRSTRLDWNELAPFARDARIRRSPHRGRTI